MTQRQAMRKLHSIWAYLNWMSDDFDAMRLVASIQDQHRMWIHDEDVRDKIYSKWRSEYRAAVDRIAAQPSREAMIA